MTKIQFDQILQGTNLVGQRFQAIVVQVEDGQGLEVANLGWNVGYLVGGQDQLGQIHIVPPSFTPVVNAIQAQLIGNLFLLFFVQVIDGPDSFGNTDQS